MAKASVTRYALSDGKEYVVQESVAAGEWISTWLSPVAYFLLDVALAVLFLAALKLSLNALHRVRSKRP